METAADLATAAPDPAAEAAPAGAHGAEADLVRAARAGDVAAFERLYRTTVGRVYGLCLRMTGSAALAEELTQDVFVRAWRRLATFRGESAFSTWLTRLAVHVVVSERRTRRTRDARFQFAADLEEFAGAAPTARPGTALDLERAVAALPPQARRVFVLHDVEGWRHAEIAQRTGLAVLVAATSVITAALVSRRAPSPRTPAAAAGATAGSLQLARARGTYEAARAQLLAALAARRGSLSPATRKVVSDNLAIIDAAVREMEAALARDPGNRELPVLLVTAYRQEIDVLRRATGIPARG